MPVKGKGTAIVFSKVIWQVGCYRLRSWSVSSCMLRSGRCVRSLAFSASVLPELSGLEKVTVKVHTFFEAIFQSQKAKSLPGHRNSPFLV